MSAAAEWLSANARWCAAYNARITSDACRKYREQQGVYNDLCRGCDGEMSGYETYRTGVCVRCGGEEKIIARGLCSKCYQRVRRDGRLDEYAVKVSPAELTPPPDERESASITLTFEGEDLEICDYFCGLAEADRRPVDQEIMCALELIRDQHEEATRRAA